MFAGPHDDVFVAESALWLSAPLFLHFAASPRGVSPFGIELLQQQVEKEEAKVSNFYASFHLAKPSQSAKSRYASRFRTISRSTQVGEPADDFGDKTGSVLDFFPSS